MNCFAHTFYTCPNLQANGPLKLPSSPLEAPFKPPWRSSLLQAPLKSPSSPFKPLRSRLHVRKASSPLQAPLKPFQTPLKPSKSEAPLKPPSSLLEAPFNAEALFKPPTSPRQAPWSLLKVKPPSSALEAPLKPLWSPLKPFEGEAPFDLQPSSPPPCPQTPRGLVNGLSRNQPHKDAPQNKQQKQSSKRLQPFQVKQ